MARTPFATEIHDTPQKSTRIPGQGQPTFIVIHHAATESFSAVVQMEMGGKQVSSTVVIKDGQVASMFDETYRAWSLSSQYWDSVSLSSETCNSGGAAQGWPISEASYTTLSKVVAEWCVRWGIPCDREHIMGHREVYTRYGASYATACPGGINLDRVVALANARISAGTAGGGNTPIPNEPEAKEDNMAYPEFLPLNTIAWPFGYTSSYPTDTFNAVKGFVGAMISENPEWISQWGWAYQTFVNESWNAVTALESRTATAAAKATVEALKASGIPVKVDLSDEDIAQIGATAAAGIKIPEFDIPTEFTITGKAEAKP